MGLKALSLQSAAVAIAAAAVLTPAGVAQADPDITAPGAGVAGNAVLGYLLDDGDAENNDGIGGDHPLDPIFNGDGDLTPNFFENDIWWFGPSNQTPPPPLADFTIDIYSVLPAGLQPLWGWFLNGDIDWEACVFGASVRLGPYGSVTGSVAQHC